MDLRSCRCLEETRNNKSVRLSICCLHDDIIEQILLKLPIKSLLKSKCVSKSWCRLISSKQFIKTHLENSKKNTDLSRDGLVYICAQRYYTVCFLPSLSYERINDAVEFDRTIYDDRNLISCVDILGSCDGLCCIHKVHPLSFFIWNPSTKKCNKLPDIDIDIDIDIDSYGFGFDPCTDDYKILLVCDIEVILYSLKANCWKTTKERKDDSLFGEEMGLFLNGKLHWAGMRSGDRVIMSFDLGTEKQGIIEQPHYVSCGEYDAGLFEPSLRVLDGCLCMLYECNRSRVDLWVMRQYGVKESWNKVVCLPYITGDPERNLYSAYYYVKDGEVVNFYTWRYLNFFSDTTVTQAHEYIESMVSPFPDGEAD